MAQPSLTRSIERVDDDAAVQGRLHRREDDILDRFLMAVWDACKAPDSALGKMHRLLSGADGVSILSPGDARRYAAVGGPPDAELATCVRLLYATANFLVAEQLRGELSDDPF